MSLARYFMESFSDKLAIPDDDGTNRRIRTGEA
jgi:hypothetical protein